MRPLFTKHESHPVRSRFSGFGFTRNSIKGGQRIPEDKDTAADSSTAKTRTNQTVTGKILTSIPLIHRAAKAPRPVTETINEPDESNEAWRMDGWEIDIIRPLPPGAHSHYSIGTPEYPAKNRRRKEHWEIVEEREREEERRMQEEKLDPSTWEQRRQPWERMESMSSQDGTDGRKTSPSPQTPHPLPSSGSWYNGWGNRMGNRDGSQGWELELYPWAGGLDLTPMAEPGEHPEGRKWNEDDEPFGKF
jgi:hypothetical protein